MSNKIVVKFVNNPEENSDDIKEYISTCLRNKYRIIKIIPIGPVKILITFSESIELKTLINGITSHLCPPHLITPPKKQLICEEYKPHIENPTNGVIKIDSEAHNLLLHTELPVDILNCTYTLKPDKILLTGHAGEVDTVKNGYEACLKEIITLDLNLPIVDEDLNNIILAEIKSGEFNKQVAMDLTKGILIGWKRKNVIVCHQVIMEKFMFKTISMNEIEQFDEKTLDHLNHSAAKKYKLIYRRNFNSLTICGLKESIVWNHIIKYKVINYTTARYSFKKNSTFKLFKQYFISKAEKNLNCQIHHDEEEIIIYDCSYPQSEVIQVLEQREKHIKHHKILKKHYGLKKFLQTEPDAMKKLKAIEDNFYCTVSINQVKREAETVKMSFTQHYNANIKIVHAKNVSLNQIKVITTDLDLFEEMNIPELKPLNDNLYCIFFQKKYCIFYKFAQKTQQNEKENNFRQILRKIFKWTENFKQESIALNLPRTIGEEALLPMVKVLNEEINKFVSSRQNLSVKDIFIVYENESILNALEKNICKSSLSVSCPIRKEYLEFEISAINSKYLEKAIKEINLYLDEICFEEIISNVGEIPTEALNASKNSFLTFTYYRNLNQIKLVGITQFGTVASYSIKLLKLSYERNNEILNKTSKNHHHHHHHQQQQQQKQQQQQINLNNLNRFDNRN